MEIAELRHLAEELKEIPYIKSDVTHVFTMDNKKLLSLRFAKDVERYQVTVYEGLVVNNYNEADEAAAAIKDALDCFHGI